MGQLQVSHAVGKQIDVTHSAAAIDATDTLGLEEYGDEIWQYGSPTGYVFGTNDLEGQVQGTTVHQLNYEYAAGYIVNGSYNIIGAMVWFGGKENVSGTPADLKVKMYNLAENKALATGQSTAPDAIGPNQSLASVNLAFDDVDTASFNTPTYAFFANPVWTNQDFALSVDIKDLYGSPADTVWIYASEDGASDGTYTWTKIGFDISAQTFWALSTGMLQGGLDVNLAIFAIAAESGVGIEEQGFFNGVKMTTYPNPALSSDNVTIQYGLETSAERVDIHIFDMNGKQVFTSALGAKASGTYSLNVPAGTLSAGSYIYSIDADGKRLAKRMEVLK
jgi:hypothetical protein